MMGKPRTVTNEENEKDLTPGVLICNGKEDKCFKDGNDEEETPSSILFSVFSDDKEDEANLIACKNCH